MDKQSPPLCRQVRPMISVLVAAMAAALTHGAAFAASKTYTLDADFALGLLDNVNFTAVPNQLQVNLIGVGGKFIFVANHNEDSVSKFDTTDQFNASGVLVAPGKEVARYKTFAGNFGQSSGGNPSRLAIDVDGNAYVLNRMPGINSPPFLMKILVDNAIDRNGNGLIDTSEESNGIAGIQAAEIKPLTSNTAAGIGDERVAWTKPIGTGTSFGRSVCIAPDGKLWVGIWNQARYYRVDPATGDTLGIGPSNLPFVSTSPWNPYGCTVDRNGILWSATIGSGGGGLGRVDTNTGATTRIASPYSGSNYGIAQGNGKIYQAPFNAGYGWASYDPASNVWARSPASHSGAGIAIDGNGDILSTDYSGIRKYSGATGALIWSKSEGGTTYGVMIDGSNDVWVMNLSTNRATKYRGTDGSLVGFLPTGAYPYVYTDGSGLTTRNQTVNRIGTWTVVYDGGASATPWGKVNWTDLVPAGASVEVAVRSSDTQAALDLQTYIPVSKNTNFNLTGRFIQIRSRLQMNAANETPILYDLTVNSRITTCDIDADGDVDSSDLALIRSAIGQTPTAGDPRDATGDGKITINDVRACTLQCTRASCATN
jgi:hypothetical protein